MKTRFQKLFLLSALITVPGLMTGSRATAQPFTVLHDFTAYDYNPATGTYTNSDGSRPQAGWVLSGNTLYGAADSGGSSDSGTVFKINTDGTGFGTVHNFSVISGPFSTNGDGAYPDGTLVISGSTLYGTAYNGGATGNGTVFKVNINGSNFTTLHSFTAMSGALSTNGDGANPEVGLAISGSMLFGTAEHGGASGKGAIFAVNTNGTGFTNLHSFTGGSDGDLPACLLASGNTLYGTSAGFTSGNGTVFKMNTNGTGFTILHTFTTSNFAPIISGGPGPEPRYTNSDGFLPTALTLSGTNLYGTTYWGGTNGNGAVFRINTDGSGFTNLHSFSASHTNSNGDYLNTEGTHPIQFGGLVLSGNYLFGTAYLGGSSGNGAVFTISTNGTGYATLYSFPAADYDSDSGNNTNTDGANPYAGLVLSGTNLYGTAKSGGTAGEGTVFSLSLPQLPQLTITPAGANVIVTWPTNVAGFAYAGFTLLSTTNLASPSVWITNTPAPVVVNGSNTVTNPASGARKFYRLMK